MRRTPLMVATAALTVVACSSDDPVTPPPTAPQTAAVTAAADANAFQPPEVTIARGGTVTWSFAARSHNVVFDAVAGAPQNIGGPGAAQQGRTNTQEQRTFDRAGRFTYTCSFHNGMNGTVVVQ